VLALGKVERRCQSFVLLFTVAKQIPKPRIKSARLD